MSEPLTPEQEYCIKCQHCCKQVAIRTSYWIPSIAENPQDAFEMKRFFETWGFKIVEAKDTKTFDIFIEKPCQHLTESGCSIYGKRPHLCRKYKGDASEKEFCIFQKGNK